MKKLDVTGQKYGRLLAVELAKPGLNGTFWRFICDCGANHVANLSLVRYGSIKSCGCLQKEKASEAGRKSATHKMSHSCEWRIWAGMRSRCRSSANSNFPNYGGRGIKVCERWQIFDNFYADMGQRPSQLHTIDRIDNDGDYEPSNCRWATAEEQAHNRCNSILIDLAGEKIALSEGARRLGIPYQTAYWRFCRNRPIAGERRREGLSG